MEKTESLINQKNELIRNIEKRTNSIINDNRAFIYSKIQQATLGQNFIYPIGGGNFLMTLGVFAVLNLLSKINSVLNGAELWKETEKEKLDLALHEFKKQNNKYKDLHSSIFIGQIKKTERDCFLEFYTDTKDIISWGIESEEIARKFWSDFRNKLSHIALPHQPVAANSPAQLKDIDFDNFITYLRMNKKDILGLNGVDDKGNVYIALDIELLSEKLSDLCLFIKKKIENCSDKNILKNIKVLIS